MFRKSIVLNESQMKIFKSEWFSFEFALENLPDKIIISPTIASGTEEGQRVWLEQELDLIEYSYSKEYHSQWHGAKYLTSVTVPEELGPYEESYTDLAFALVQDSIVYFFARKEAIVIGAVAKTIQTKK